MKAIKLVAGAVVVAAVFVLAVSIAPRTESTPLAPNTQCLTVHGQAMGELVCGR